MEANMNPLNFVSGWSACSYYLSSSLFRRSSGHCSVTDCSEFANYMESILLSKEQLLIVGDMNIHVDDASDADARNFLEFWNHWGYSSMSEDQHIFMDILWILLLHA